SSRRGHTRFSRDWSSDVCSSDLFHMVLARYSLGELRVIDRLRETVRMADGLDADGGLAPQSRERALECLARFGQRLRGVERLHRSEEHTSELQSRENLVCRLLLE